MTPEHRTALLELARSLPEGWLIPVRALDLIELVEPVVARDLAAEDEAVDALRAELDAGGML